MAEKKDIPTEKEIAQLPRWAQVAFAARCAWRVQPLFKASWPNAPQKHVDAVIRVIEMAENSAAKPKFPKDFSTTAFNAAENARLVAGMNTRLSAREAAHEAVRAGAYAADAAAIAAMRSEDDQYSTYEAIRAAARAAARAGSNETECLVIAGIRRDFDQLLKFATENKWDNETPVGPEVFGPMWPDGEPDWQKIAAQIQKEQVKGEKTTIELPEIESAHVTSINDIGEGSGEVAIEVPSSDKSSGIPSEEEIKQLPRWAQVAFAARCARRVQPLFVVLWPEALQKYIDAVEQAITVTETAAAVAAAAANAAVLAASEATVAADAAARAVAAARAADGAADNVARVAAKAATVAAIELAVYAADDVARAVNATKYTVDRIVATAAADTAIRKDYDRLLKLAKEKNWDDDTPVGPEVFGPMWPEGEPEGWPEIGDEKEKEVEKQFIEQPLIDIYIDPGEASKETIREVLEALSDYQRAQGGLGLEYRIDGLFVHAYKEVSV